MNDRMNKLKREEREALWSLTIYMVGEEPGPIEAV